MENTYIIFDEGFEKQAEFIGTELSIEKISYQAHENERGFHEWLTREFKNKDIRRILIPLSLPSKEENTEGLLLGLQIRLNYELPIEKRCIPIVFITGLNVEKILSTSTFDRDSNPQNLLFSEGIYISSSDIDEIKQKLGMAKPVKDYNLFLRRLSIHRKEKVGGHDIANAWGCYKLAQVVGINEDIFSKEAIAKYLKQLYAKYLICLNESYNDSKMSYIDLQPISCSGKKVLFIDDKSDEGWGDLMGKIFKSAGKGFVCVDSGKYKTNGSFTDYDGFISECKSYIGQRWDLIIVDIRLNPNIEDIDSNIIAPTEFSGYKLIDDFLNNNEGYQILVSTASNKIWNVNAALKRGAKGYYIKESPDFNYPVAETKRQYELFKDCVQSCFDNSYLQDIYKTIEEDIKPSLPKNDFGKSISKQLDLSFFLIKKAETDEQFAFAFISLYMVIELINKESTKLQLVSYSVEQEKVFVNKIDDVKFQYWDVINNQFVVSEVRIDASEVLLDYSLRDGKGIDIAEDGSVRKTMTILYGKASEFVKIANFMKDNGFDDRIIIDVYHRIQARNWYIHKDAKLDKRNNTIQREIYSKIGFQALFNDVKTICSCICP